jgi:4-hydroxybenzoate polyprenyltransferase
MKATWHKLITWAELTRISNSPTVVSNVVVGCALVVEPLPVRSTITAVIAVALLYIGGMAFNDVADATWDRAHRSLRPIPSGRISRGTAAAFGVICLAGGVGITALHGPASSAIGVALVMSLLLYDFTHKRLPSTVILMGVCRGLGYALASAMMAWPVDIALLVWPTTIVPIYTILLTIVARSEHNEGTSRRSWLAWLVPITPLAMALGLQPDRWTFPLLMGAVLVAWAGLGVRYLYSGQPQPKRAVLTWIAGFCLIDAYTLTLIDRPSLTLIPLTCFVTTVVAHRRVPGT